MFNKIKGKNNKIYIIKNGKTRLLHFFETIKGFKITITGNNNVIKINCDCPDVKNCSILIVGNNSNITIGKSFHMHNLSIAAGRGDNQVVEIGNNNSIEGMSLYLWEEGAQVKIGEHLLASSHIYIWATDGHAVIDKDSKELLNGEKKGVIIGNYCWLGQHSFLTKNAIIPDSTIVSAHSVVTKGFSQTNTVIAGNPAKIIKENIEWRYETPQEYKELCH